MMRHWLIYFSFAMALAQAYAAAGTVAGVVQLDANLHSPAEQKRHLQDIVIWLEPQDGALDLPNQPPHMKMLQKDKMFHPHILPVVVGTAVDFPNADPIFHNAFSNYDGQLFDVALYPPGTSRTVVFKKAGVVRVFCNIHPSMAAIILVLKTLYFAKANADGSYRIPNVPAGQYGLCSFDERANGGNQKTLQLTVQAGAVETSAPVLHISEAGYVTLPHKNKYGQDYPPGAESYGGSSGPPK
jgi:hypothetical protein